MNEGDVALAALPQTDGRSKPRPVVLLRRMPRFHDWLVCGLGTQLHQEAVGFDEKITPTHPDFRRSGLKAPSLVRLGFLATLPTGHLLGVLGSLSPERHQRLLQRLGDFFSRPPS